MLPHPPIIPDFAVTFSAQRSVYTNNKRIGFIYRCLQGGVLFYVVYMSLTAYAYLKVDTSTQGIVTGWVEAGTMYTATGQEYVPTTCDTAAATCTKGTPISASVTAPPYCSAPYSDNYVQDAEWDYSGVRCARYAEPDMGLKRTPSFLFVSTLMHERKYTMKKCSDSHTDCKSDSPGVSVVGDSCRCRAVSNYYPINPEGMKLFLKHEFTSHFMSGNSRVAENDWGIMTTYFRQEGDSKTLPLTPTLTLPLLDSLQEGGS